MELLWPYLKFPLVGNSNIAQLRAFAVGIQCHHVLCAPNFRYRAEMGGSFFLLLRSRDCTA